MSRRPATRRELRALLNRIEGAIPDDDYSVSKMNLHGITGVDHTLTVGPRVSDLNVVLPGPQPFRANFDVASMVR